MGSTAFRFVSKTFVTGVLTLSSLVTACGDDDDRKRSEESPTTADDASADAGVDAGEGGAPLPGDAAGQPFDAATDAGPADASGTTEFDGSTAPGGGAAAEAGVPDARAQEPGAADAAADSAQPSGSAPDAAASDAQVRADASSTPPTDSATPQPTDSATPQPTDSATPPPADSGAPNDAQVDGGSSPGAGDARVDSGPSAGDAGGGGDAGAGRDASAAADASTSRDASGSGTCDVNDPRFGCGESDGEWVHFESGFSYDRTTGLVWSRAGTTSNNQNDRNDGCEGIDFDGVNAFRLPTVREVARLSAGCGEPCLEGIDGCRPCAAGDGPHVNGGYCRPEFPDCQATFTVDTCEVGSTEVSCPSPRHWYYDERIGIFRLLDTGDRVPGSCVGQVTTPVP